MTKKQTIAFVFRGIATVCVLFALGFQIAGAARHLIIIPLWFAVFGYCMSNHFLLGKSP